MAGHGLPGDRRYALALANIPAQTEPRWLPREQLVNLSRFPRLALLDTRVDGQRLTIRRRDRVVLSTDLDTAYGRSVVSAFFAAFLAGENFGHPRLVEFRDGFGDSPRPQLSVVSTATLDEVARMGGRRFEPEELRANLVLSGLPPRMEQNWIGHRLRVGQAVLAITEPMDRPLLPELHSSTFGHGHLGILAEVVTGGEIRLGDEVVEAGEAEGSLRRHEGTERPSP